MTRPGKVYLAFSFAFAVLLAIPALFFDEQLVRTTLLVMAALFLVVGAKTARRMS